MFAGQAIEKHDFSFATTDAVPVFPASLEVGDHRTYDADVTVWFSISVSWAF